MFRQPVLRRLARPSNGSVCSSGTQVPRRAFSLRTQRAPTRAVENLNIRKLAKKSYDYERNRRIFLWSGTIAGLVSFVYTAYRLQQELTKPVKLDSSLPSSDPLSSADAAERKVVIRDEEGRELVPTGNTTVPTFPRTITLPADPEPSTPRNALTTTISAAPTSTEYTLVGYGVRTVSFISIQVYVVGYYIATADIASLQSALTKKVNPIATTLVPGERDELRNALLDPVEGEKTWEELLARGIPARSAFRIVPVRDTDFHHLRDGFVRSIQAKAGPEAAKDDSFGEAMREFRAVFNRGSVPKKKEMLLVRDAKGRLTIAFDGAAGSKKGKAPEEATPMFGSRHLIGTVDDERVSHALWLHYLAGTKVASEPARKSIVEGIMEFVERPIGTVAAQVV